MAKRKVLVCSHRLNTPDHPQLKKLQAAGLELVYNTLGRLYTREEVLAAIPGCFATIAGGERYDEALLAAADQLELIARFGVGYDTVDVDAATRHGVTLAMAFGSNHESVADMALALMSSVLCRVETYSHLVKSGGWGSQAHASMFGATVGIVGLGRIGRAVARRCKGFDMRVLANDIKPDPDYALAHGIELVDLETIFRASDIVSLHCSAGPGTKDLVNRQRLALMKPGAFFINTARGSMVDEPALLEALSQGGLGGAGLDVFKTEPPAGSPLLKTPNIVCSPHAAGGNARSFELALEICVRNILAVAEGRRPEPELVVNPQAKARKAAAVS
ncbi:MAG: phosphoglycerate dehydrogenase [Proteobacteria bacterium]|nr:phosphoglycerate dehydrogenase [Pseudomonadota bacterium]